MYIFTQVSRRSFVAAVAITLPFAGTLSVDVHVGNKLQ